MIYVDEPLSRQLANLGVQMTEDDHLVTLRCGDKELVFSALAVTEQTLRSVARRMAAEYRFSLGRK